MKLRLWHVDAFAERPFRGNPAAVVPLKTWLDDAVLQAIAQENNLSETAFFTWRETGSYDLRWFTPAAEIDLCGHATLASAWVIFSEIEPELEAVRFATKSGILSVERSVDGHNRMSLPADPVQSFTGPPGFAEQLGRALGVHAPDEVHIGRKLLAVWNDPAAIRRIKLGDVEPVMAQSGRWGLITTANTSNAGNYDFISRFFSIGYGVPEDPVTGAAHCALTPFWAKRLGKKTLRAYQASARGGELLCTDEGDRVTLAGPCALYLRGEIEI